MERTPRRIRTIAVLTLALAGTLPLAPGWAQVAVVEGGPSLIQQILNQLNTYTQRYQDNAEYGAEAQRWIQRAQHMQQQLVRAQGLFAQSSVALDQPVSEVGDDWNVAEKCGASFSMASLAGQFVLRQGDDFVAKQREVCARIQVARNRKFNATVRFLKRVSPQLESQLQQIERRRNASNDQGNVMAVSVDAQNFDNWMAAQFQNWDMQTRMYDGYIASMEDAQRTLAEIALKGDRSKPFGSPVKTVILQGALAR